MSRFKTFLTRCVSCGGTTSKTYAKSHEGKCKTCVTGVAPAPRVSEYKRQYGRCEDAPCCGCCGPQGDGDYYGVSAQEEAMGLW